MYVGIDPSLTGTAMAVIDDPVRRCVPRTKTPKPAALF